MLLRSIVIASTVLIGLTMTSGEASARWVCRAASPTGSWGWGAHNFDEGYARRRALRECAVRTPQGYTCHLQSCVWQ